MLNDLIFYKIKKVAKCKILLKKMIHIINQNTEKIYNFTEYSLPIAFLRDIHDEYESLKDAEYEQSKFANKLKSIDKGIKSIKKFISK